MSLFSVLLVLLLSLLLSQGETATWGELKSCAQQFVRTCHDRCASSLDPSIRDGAKKCEEDMTARAAEAKEDCLRQKGFDVSNSTTCWEETQNEFSSSRDRRQLLTLVQGFQSYADCIKQCQTEDATKECQKGCIKYDDPVEARAIDACGPNGDAMAAQKTKIVASAAACLAFLALG